MISSARSPSIKNWHGSVSFAKTQCFGHAVVTKFEEKVTITALSDIEVNKIIDGDEKMIELNKNNHLICSLNPTSANDSCSLQLCPHMIFTSS